MEVGIIIIASIGAFFMAFNNGANDVANAFASAVGSKAITIKQALVIAAVLNLVGALLLGSHVALTMINKVIDPQLSLNVNEYVLGMLTCLLCSGIFVLFSTLTGMPVSSTHAIVGSLTGVVIVLGGFSAVNWKLLGIIALTWIISPVLAGALAWLSIKIIRLYIFKPKKKKKILKRTRKIVPVFIGITTWILVFSALKRSVGVENTHIKGNETWLAIAFGFVMYWIVWGLITWWSKRTPRSEKGAESLFRKLQLGTSCYVSFAHGSNDVSNSVAPVIAIFMVLGKTTMAEGASTLAIPIWILLLGGVGMSLGIMILGHKVMATLGKKLTLLTNSRGFSVDFSTATTVVMATLLGMPVSSTHAATGSIVGIGIERGKGGLNFSVLIKILSTWIITVPCAALLTMGMYKLLLYIFL